jgi:multiple RNA-binding domain-containing protein 1
MAKTSRLIVKNLPKYLKDDRFRQHFSEHFEVTDAKVLRTKYVDVLLRCMALGCHPTLACSLLCALCLCSTLRVKVLCAATVSTPSTTHRGGKSRRFGYVGFKTADDAERAREYFNGTFVDTCKISADFALPVRPPPHTASGRFKTVL